MNMPISFNTLSPAPPPAPPPPATTPPAADPNDPASFAATLKQATKASAAPHQGVEASHTTPAAPSAGAPPARPIGEELDQVPGANEAKILSGADQGMFLNEATANPRQDEAFRLEHHDGRWLHVYGSGDQQGTEVVDGPSAGGAESA